MLSSCAAKPQDGHPTSAHQHHTPSHDACVRPRHGRRAAFLQRSRVLPRPRSPAGTKARITCLGLGSEKSVDLRFCLTFGALNLASGLDLPPTAAVNLDRQPVESMRSGLDYFVNCNVKQERVNA